MKPAATPTTVRVAVVRAPVMWNSTRDFCQQKKLDLPTLQMFQREYRMNAH
uniref:Uncharacterized protein n=1 Tax=Arundo donax TaxID=35708 RepID=A0A0A9AHF2_ARUDO